MFPCFFLFAFLAAMCMAVVNAVPASKGKLPTFAGAKSPRGAGAPASAPFPVKFANVALGNPNKVKKTGNGRLH